MPDNDSSAGATPAAGGATPPQSPPAPPAAGSAPPATPPTPPATDDTAALGEPGKRALDAMKAERDAAKREAADAKKRADDLELASKSDTDKAIAQAKKDGADEVTAKWSAQVRRAEVKAALTAEGINPSALDWGTTAPEFASLKVSDDGEVEGLAEAIKAVKASKPDLFTKPGTAGTADGGARGSRSGLTREVIAAMTPEEYAKRRTEVMEWMTQQK